jgi:hypothetical protein
LATAIAQAIVMFAPVDGNAGGGQAAPKNRSGRERRPAKAIGQSRPHSIDWDPRAKPSRAKVGAAAVRPTHVALRTTRTRRNIEAREKTRAPVREWHPGFDQLGAG